MSQNEVKTLPFRFHPIKNEVRRRVAVLPSCPHIKRNRLCGKQRRRRKRFPFPIEWLRFFFACGFVRRTTPSCCALKKKMVPIAEGAPYKLGKTRYQKLQSTTETLWNGIAIWHRMKLVENQNHRPRKKNKSTNIEHTWDTWREQCAWKKNK